MAQGRAGPPLPDKPSIAVLPFANLSGDPEQEYFADGMVEEIITALSRIRWLFVIARNSSFTYKGQAVDVKQVGRELGVRYVLEGSVRKGGQRVRITGQLIDAISGTHLWADRFDGSLEDVFELQDQVAISVAALSSRHCRPPRSDVRSNDRRAIPPPTTFICVPYRFGPPTRMSGQSWRSACSSGRSREIRIMGPRSVSPRYATSCSRPVTGKQLRSTSSHSHRFGAAGAPLRSRRSGCPGQCCRCARISR